MSNLDRSVIYTYRIQTNFDQVSSEIARQATEAESDVDGLQQSVDQLNNTSDAAKAHLKEMKQEVGLTLAALGAMSATVNNVSNGLVQLGIVSGEDVEILKNVTAGFQLMIGMASGLKALALVQETLNLQALKGAIINTYASVLESPWKLALVSAGAGAAMGVAMAYGTQSGGASQTTNNIYIRDASGGQANAANAISATFNGGKVL